MKMCCQNECLGKAVSKGLCNRHYKQKLEEAKKKACACGCGKLTSYTFSHGHHTRLFSSEEQSRRGRMNTGDALRNTGEGKGYRKRNQRHEHRVVAEKMIGRPLAKGEIVHHINHDHRDNRPENLRIMTQSEHAKLHAEQTRLARNAKTMDPPHIPEKDN